MLKYEGQAVSNLILNGSRFPLYSSQWLKEICKVLELAWTSDKIGSLIECIKSWETKLSFIFWHDEWVGLPLYGGSLNVIFHFKLEVV